MPGQIATLYGSAGLETTCLWEDQEKEEQAGGFNGKRNKSDGKPIVNNLLVAEKESSQYQGSADQKGKVKKKKHMREQQSFSADQFAKQSLLFSTFPSKHICKHSCMLS